MNVAEVTIGFRPLQLTDEALVRGWFNAPHVAQWWGNPEKAVREAMGHVATGDALAFIIQGNGHDLGYIRGYEAPGEIYFADRAPGVKGMDLYIGFADLVGRGLGRRAIRAFADYFLANGSSEIVADPNPKNIAAVSAYRHAGFSLYRVHRSPEYGRLILMSKTA